jgi:hypothetical protein
MSSEIVIVLGILGAAVILFAKSRFEPDTVALLTVLSLILTKSLSSDDDPRFGRVKRIPHSRESPCEYSRDGPWQL